MLINRAHDEDDDDGKKSGTKFIIHSLQKIVPRYKKYYKHGYNKNKENDNIVI